MLEKLEKLTRGKHSSLFCPIVIDEEEKGFITSTIDRRLRRGRRLPDCHSEVQEAAEAGGRNAPQRDQPRVKLQLSSCDFMPPYHDLPKLNLTAITTNEHPILTTKVFNFLGIQIFLIFSLKINPRFATKFLTLLKKVFCRYSCQPVLVFTKCLTNFLR
jgi:hypothetical protein